MQILHGVYSHQLFPLALESQLAYTHIATTSIRAFIAAAVVLGE
jgi:hypothetical protein